MNNIIITLLSCISFLNALPQMKPANMTSTSASVTSANPVISTTKSPSAKATAAAIASAAASAPAEATPIASATAPLAVGTPLARAISSNLTVANTTALVNDTNVAKTIAKIRELVPPRSNTSIEKALSDPPLNLQHPYEMNFKNLPADVRDADVHSATNFLYSRNVSSHIKVTEAYEEVKVPSWIGTLIVNSTKPITKICVTGWVGYLVVTTPVTLLHVTGYVGAIYAPTIEKINITGFVDSFKTQVISKDISDKLGANTYGGGYVKIRNNMLIDVNGTTTNDPNVANTIQKIRELVPQRSNSSIEKALSDPPLNLQHPSTMDFKNLPADAKTADIYNATHFLFSRNVSSHIKVTEAYEEVKVTSWIGTLIVNSTKPITKISVTGWVGYLVVTTPVTLLHVTGYVGAIYAPTIEKINITGFVDSFKTQVISKDISDKLGANTYGGGYVKIRNNMLIDVNGTTTNDPNVANTIQKIRELVPPRSNSSIEQKLSDAPLYLQHPTTMDFKNLPADAKTADIYNATHFLFERNETARIKVTEAYKNVTVPSWIGTLIINSTEPITKICVPGWVGYLVVTTNVSLLHVSGYVGAFYAPHVEKLNITGGQIKSFKSLSVSKNVEDVLKSHQITTL